MAATKVELFEQIRRDSWHGGLSVRALAAKYGVHRRLVREALTACRAGPAQDARAAVGPAGAVQGADRRVAAGGPGRPAQAAAHGDAGPRPAAG